jgi:hypothetical protein
MAQTHVEHCPGGYDLDGTRERASGVRVAALREINQGGQWVASPVAAATVQKLEDIILTRARDLRRAAIVN